MLTSSARSATSQSRILYRECIISETRNRRLILGYSYLCGHSHCYVCIRLWLERKWSCPDCVTPMYSAPFRHYAEEGALASAFPNWNDMSVVDYAFTDLVFPVRRD